MSTVLQFVEKRADFRKRLELFLIKTEENRLFLEFVYSLKAQMHKHCAFLFAW